MSFNNSGSIHSFLPGSLFPRILRDKTMDNNLIYIPNYDKQNYPFSTLKLLRDTDSS